MGEALQAAALSDEERSFVTGVQEPSAAATTEKSETKRPTRMPRTRTVTSSLPNKSAPETGPGTTVSMTFRLPADLPGRLIQVSAERKVRRETPFSQQDIVAEALREWLAARDPGGRH